MGSFIPGKSEKPITKTRNRSNGMFVILIFRVFVTDSILLTTLIGFG